VREASVFQLGVLAGTLREEEDGTFSFYYEAGYQGPPVSLTMPVRSEPYIYTRFPPFFEGLLPEGYQLEALLQKAKLDRHDYFAQLVQVGADLVGSVTVEAQ
jgi:serine/threonine-protein kinase HipA